MKRCFVLLSVLLLLCGCSKEQTPTQTTEPPQITEPTVEPEPERPNFGLYEQNTTLEVLSSGSVKMFPLPGSDYYAVATVGEKLLLFSGTENTVLTCLSEEDDPLSVTLSCYLDPNSASVQVTEQGIGYYDSSDHTLVFVDLYLQEVSRMTLPTDMISTPVLSPDWQWLYFYTADALRSLELRTGISRLLRESSFPLQEVSDIHFDGSLLECSVGDEQSIQRTFISAQTGKTRFISEADGVIDTFGERYFASWYEADGWKLLFGSKGENIRRLSPVWEGTSIPLLEQNGLVLSRTNESGSRLVYYDLERGVRTSQAWLVDVGAPQSISADVENGRIWVLAPEMNGQRQCLYCWDPSLSTVSDENSYVSPYYTAESPDTEGLEQCAQQAKELGERYGLRIRIWKDALRVMPEGYSFEAEHLVSVYQQSLTTLEEALSAFPKEIFQKMGKKSDNGKLTIALVREAYESNELGTQSYEEGVYFRSDGSSYIVLAMDEAMEQAFYHELFHAMDSYIMTECKAYDYWEELNPRGFSYDYSYITNQYREEGQHLEGETRAFIDLYSMSYPKEDRARIMEYAMLDGNEAYFESKTMQTKLKTLCQGIREGFGLTKDSSTFPWEQYLQ